MDKMYSFTSSLSAAAVMSTLLPEETHKKAEVSKKINIYVPCSQALY